MGTKLRDSVVYGAHWRKIRLEVLERDNHLCQIRGRNCTRTATQVDHIIPVVAGGPLYDERNLRAACSWCNASRQNRPKASRPSREW